MIAARERFYLIGIGRKEVDKAGRDVFDEFFQLEGNSILKNLEFISRTCEEYGAAVFYMPSIGMDLITILQVIHVLLQFKRLR